VGWALGACPVKISKLLILFRDIMSPTFDGMSLSPVVSLLCPDVVGKFRGIIILTLGTRCPFLSKICPAGRKGTYSPLFRGGMSPCPCPDVQPEERKERKTDDHISEADCVLLSRSHPRVARERTSEGTRALRGGTPGPTRTRGGRRTTPGNSDRATCSRGAR